MAITYFEKKRIFKLDTPNSSYVIVSWIKKTLSVTFIMVRN